MTDDVPHFVLLRSRPSEISSYDYFGALSLSLSRFDLHGLATFWSPSRKNRVSAFRPHLPVRLLISISSSPLFLSSIMNST
ncbi:hypothetical protein O6P43_028377 [Quillaja saponaria]|uniref:Uncharacterized protein n=1 Tax=Quillaja saponaria TaxID=32244 RepID=A0AAD7P9V6_QUISA|nr:hypothetical protein O6P43_028377 [Quillaja saponaria]